MANEEIKRKLTAILSADVKDYSRLMGQDEVFTIKTLTAHRELISNFIKQYKGRVVDTPGDNILAAFESVGRQAPEFGLDRPQFLGQPPGGFEVAVIDRSDFAGKRAPGFPYFAASEARHAVNHAVTFRTLFGGRRPRCAMREGSLYSRLLRPGGRVV